jgi:hypothetical protein
MKSKTAKLLFNVVILAIPILLMNCSASKRKDRIEEIVKDLGKEEYSLSFEKPITAKGVYKTAYGAENYLVYADPGDLICGDPIRRKFPRIPIWRIPKRVLPTCPDMVWNVKVAEQLNEFLAGADVAQFKGLRTVQFAGGGALFVTEKFTSQYAKLGLDKMDETVFDGLDGERYLMLMSNPMPGFQRDFYGYADLGQFGLKGRKINPKDFFKPKLQGCFDPRVLEQIRERLIKVNPGQFESLQVTQLEQMKDVSVLALR